ncbi:MAG: DNA cytosine methyltransferase [Stenotrophomonas sp.]|uniref:DNA cytosine methyltransferase n=1 Tax=Stenotrophomonas sp. TaxID=69392 RepID=UPI001354225A|nr:DNA cytosine methyltransferase [Stenotrophomonas sp.]MTI72205.1 DNA cytosine methyltransferase [Stenotrophomonas sp.]
MRAIDLFAGLGGFSEGAEQAGCQVVWAANHWPAAVQVHANNHPETAHVCQDLQQADWTQVPAHDLLLASPACQGHTRARGKERPHHDATRATAWAVVSALECHRPALGLIENVPEFTKWALFPAWCSAINALGYAISPHLVDAADHGVPQHRERVLIALTRSKHPIQLALPRREHVPAANIIDFDAGRWCAVEKPGRSAATLLRVQNGRRQHGDRFLTAFYGNERGGRSLSRPVGTITTRDRWAVVDGSRMRMLSVNEARRAMGFRATYQLPQRQKDAMHMLGNAVCPPVVRDVIEALRAAA